MKQTGVPQPPAGAELVIFQRNLCDWFATAARDLPWRRTRDPYYILVSEIMLQQTQVDRVRPKYMAFLAAFPTPAALAAASTAEVIKQWAGLGYNRRAVNLQRAVRAVLAQYDGQFPRTAEALRQLPGIGPYTAGAVACFAFEQDVAFLDTNIRRVVRRCLVGPEDQEPLTSDRALTDLAQAVIPPGQGWTWNQAIMELGALICTANAPACWRCPIREHCRAYTAWRIADENIFTTMRANGAQNVASPRKQTVRRVAEQREDTYIGSSRYYRGRLVAALRELAPGEGIPLTQLGRQIKTNYTVDDLPWLRKLVDGLVQDGLVELRDGEVRLPTD